MDLLIRPKLVGDMAIEIGVKSTPVLKGIRKGTKTNRRPEGPEGLLWEGLPDFHQSTLHKRLQRDRQPR